MSGKLGVVGGGSYALPAKEVDSLRPRPAMRAFPARLRRIGGVPGGKEASMWIGSLLMGTRPFEKVLEEEEGGRSLLPEPNCALRAGWSGLGIAP